MPVLPTKTSLISIDEILKKSALEEGAMAADFGCGRSIFFLYALSTLVGKSGHVYGIDILPEVIESAERDIKHHKLDNISIIRGDLENSSTINLTPASLKAVFLINTLSQAADSRAMLAEAKNLIAPDGRIVIVDWKTDSSPLGPLANQRLSEESVLATLEHIGCHTLDRFEAGPYHYGISVSKNN